MWHLTNLSVRNRIVTLVVALLLAGAAIWALLGLKVELMPNIDFPYTTVVTVYPNATRTLSSRMSVYRSKRLSGIDGQTRV